MPAEGNNSRGTNENSATTEAVGSARDAKKDAHETPENTERTGRGRGESATPENGSESGNVPRQQNDNVPRPKTGGRFARREWRIEVNTRANGRTRFFNYRRGSGNNRKAKYGGTFRHLTAARMAQYEENKRTYAKRKNAAKKRRAASK